MPGLTNAFDTGCKVLIGVMRHPLRFRSCWWARIWWLGPPWWRKVGRCYLFIWLHNHMRCIRFILQSKSAHLPVLLLLQVSACPLTVLLVDAWSYNWLTMVFPATPLVGANVVWALVPKTLTADALDVIAAAAVYGLTDLKVKFLNVYFGNKKYLEWSYCFSSWSVAIQG